MYNKISFNHGIVTYIFKNWNMLLLVIEIDD